MPAASFEELYQLAVAQMLTKRPTLQVEEGFVTDFVCSAGAAMADKNEQTTQEALKKTFVDGSSGDDLTTLADDHWGVTRQEATAAEVILEFSRPTATAGAGTISAGSEVASIPDATGQDVRFVTNTNLSFGASDLGPLTVTATAVEVGADANVDPSTITRIISSLFDDTLTVTNPAEAGGGNAEESDESVRSRIRDRPKALRRATLHALAFGAKEVDTVRVATANENTLTGQVTVSVSDNSGNSTAEMVNDVIAELEEWRAAGIPVQVSGGTVLTANIDITLTLGAGASAATLSPFVISSVEAEINKLGIGETLYDSMIIAAARNVAPDVILDVTIDSSSITLDSAPNSNELIRAGTITVS